MKKIRTLLSFLLIAAMVLALAVPALAASEISLTNGDFESGTENWALVGYSSTATDTWASNNTSVTLNLWLSDTDAVAGSASYSVSLSAGTYYFTFEMAGAAMDSGLSYSVSAGGTQLVTGDSTVATTGWDVWQTITTKEFTLDATAEVTFTLSGNQTAAYWGNLDNLKLYGDGSVVNTAPDPVQADIYVPYVSGTDGDFMRGMDVSSVLSILNSGATFKDYEGNTLDGQGFFNLLAATGTNWVRLRVWNDPFDSNGNGYGGGNCDVEAAKTMGLWATNAGLRVLIDFHYSDFWADPGKQQAPKAWVDYTVAQKETAVYDYTYESVKYLVDSGVDVGMVQVGNETTNSVCGVSGWEDMCKIFSAGSSAVRAVDEDILVAVHFTNPESEGNYAYFAGQLDTYSVDYDVFASSYYPYWHGTLTNLTSVLKNVADTYGKKVIVAETSWGFTLEDGDGHSNTVREGSNDSGDYAFSAQGQAQEIAAVAKAVRNVGANGVGVFYWEPAWIPVQVYDASASDAQQTLNENKALWEQYGSGWASSYAGEYDADDAGVWYGGSSWDNQALFDFDGTPLESLKTYQYMQTGTTGYIIEVSGVENPTLTYTVGSALSLPETLAVSYTVGDDQQMAVVWNETDVAAVDMNTPGTYVVNGVVEGGLTAVCTVEVKEENLLSNPGFESSTMSMYTISQTYAARSTDDPYADSYSLHFYSSDTVSFTAEQTITLQPGSYSFSLYGQGGDMGSNAVCYAYVKYGTETLTDNFALTGWKVWANPTVSFTIAEETAVTVGISVTASQGGAWGSFDEWYLCKAAAKITCAGCGEEVQTADSHLAPCGTAGHYTCADDYDAAIHAACEHCSGLMCDGNDHGLCSICGEGYICAGGHGYGECTEPAIIRKGSTLSLEDVIYVIDIFDLKGIDLTTIDLTTDAGLLAWSVEEFGALTEVAYDADHANAGLKAYMDTGCYYGASDGIFTRYLHEDAYYVGYVKLADGTYIYSEEKLYSPSIYAYNKLDDEDASEATKDVCVALLNYISAAQKYFYPGTADTDLVNAELTAEQKAFTWENNALNLVGAVPTDKQVDRDTSVFTGKGKNLLVEEMISMVSLYKVDTAVVEAAQECGTIFWTAEQFAKLEGAPSLDNIGNGEKVIGFNNFRNYDGQWYTAAPAVAAKDMSETEYYILGYVIHADDTVSYSGVDAYSFEQYIYKNVNKDGADPVMVELAQRLFYYERAAKAALG